MTGKKSTRFPLVNFLRIKTFAPMLIVIAGLLLLFLLWLSVKFLPPEAANNPFLGASLRLWVYLFFVLFALVILEVVPYDLKGIVIAVLLSLCFAGMVMIGLKNTPYGLNGIGGDEGLLTAQVTKFANYKEGVDFAYKDLPPFYPPLYMWILGKTAGALSIEPYRMLKYGLIAIAFVLPIAVYFAWSWLRPASLSIAALLGVLVFQDWYKPYEWLSMVIFIPWWLYFVDGLGQTKPKTKIIWLILGGLIGAALLATYYYWFFIGAVSLLVLVFFQIDNPAEKQKSQRATWINRVLIFMATILFSAPYWGPLLGSMRSTGAWTFLQNRYFIPEFNILHFPFLDATLAGVVLLGGLIYLISSYNRDRLARGILVLLIGAYVWQLLGYVGLLTNIPVLSFKARDFVIYLLGLAAALGAAQLLSHWNLSVRKQWGKFVAVGVIVLSLFYGQKVAAGFANSELLSEAQDTDYPEILLTAFAKRNPDLGKDKVLLADVSTSEISVYYPVFQFISWAAVYSHPAGEYYERVEFLKELGTLSSPEWFAAAVMNNRYDHIDAIILFPQDEGYYLGYLPEKFPESSETEQIFFPSDLLNPNYFSDVDLDGYVMFSPHYEKNPLGQLPPIQIYDPSQEIIGIGDGEDFYRFLVTFEGHLSFPGIKDYRSLLENTFSK